MGLAEKLAIVTAVTMMSYTSYYRLRTVGIRGRTINMTHPAIHNIVRAKRSFIVKLNRDIIIGQSFIEPNTGVVTRRQLNLSLGKLEEGMRRMIGRTKNGAV